MSWYCPSGTSGINVGDAAAYVAAVQSQDCAKPCADDIANDGYSQCYQPKALA